MMKKEKKLLNKIKFDAEEFIVNLGYMLMHISQLIGRFFVNMWAVLCSPRPIPQGKVRVVHMRNEDIKFHATFQKVSLALWAVIAFILGRVSIMMLAAPAYAIVSLSKRCVVGSSYMMEEIIFDLSDAAQAWLSGSTVIGGFLSSHPNNLVQFAILLISLVGIAVAIMGIVIIAKAVKECFFSKKVEKNIFYFDEEKKKVV